MDICAKKFFEIVSSECIVWKSICNNKGFGQVVQGVQWMPWHMKSMKDVVSCDKLREGANNRLPGDFRMGQPSPSNVGLLLPEYIGQ